MIGQDNVTFAADLRAVVRRTGNVSPAVLETMMLEAADRLDPAGTKQRLVSDPPGPARLLAGMPVVVAR